MSTHTLVLTVDAERFDDLDSEVARRVAQWTGWPFPQAFERVEEYAEAEIVPLRTYQRKRGRGYETRVVYRATVRISV